MNLLNVREVCVKSGQQVTEREKSGQCKCLSGLSLLTTLTASGPFQLPTARQLECAVVITCHLLNILDYELLK